MPIFGMHVSLAGTAKIRSITWRMLSQLMLLRLYADILQAGSRGRQGRPGVQPSLNATDAQAQPLQSFTQLHTQAAAPGQAPSVGLSDSQQHRSVAQQSAPAPADGSREAKSRGASPVRAQKRARDDGWAGIRPGAVLEGHHKVQTWLGLETFLSLEPASYSRRILNEQVKPTCSSRCAGLPQSLSRFLAGTTRCQSGHALAPFSALSRSGTPNASSMTSWTHLAGL